MGSLSGSIGVRVMSIKWLLLLVIGICASGLLITLMMLHVIRRKETAAAYAAVNVISIYGRKYRDWGSLLLQAYQLGMKIPLLSTYIMQVKKRISYRYARDEPTLRKLTMTVVLIIVGGYGAVSAVLFWSAAPRLLYSPFSVLLC